MTEKIINVIVRNVIYMKRSLLCFLFCFIFARAGWSAPQYYCTGANSDYFKMLMNLIGSIHKSNYKNLGEIAVFDLGMTEEECDVLRKLSKVQVYSIKEDNPFFLKNFFIPGESRNRLGWYAWKPVVIKESLEMFPYVLWIDAGSVVLRSLDSLFQYIQREGYFLTTSGDELKPNDLNNFQHPIGWGATKFVRKSFALDSVKNSWILDKEPIMAGCIGIAKKSTSLFMQDWYGLTKEIKFFEDDGTAPEGWGCCRYEQTLLGILSYSRKLLVHVTDYTQTFPCNIGEGNKKIPFYITWNRDYVNEKTCIYVQSKLYDYQNHLKFTKQK
jgi:hypothetical protein